MEGRGGSSKWHLERIVDIPVHADVRADTTTAVYPYGELTETLERYTAGGYKADAPPQAETSIRLPCEKPNTYSPSIPSTVDSPDKARTVNSRARGSHSFGKSRGHQH